MADMTDDDLLRIATTLGLPFGMLDHDYCKSMEIEPGTRSYGEVTCDGMVRFARAVLAAQPAPAPEELSPEFTDTARAALLWVLWHHQGASSAVGQPIRFALGMGAHDRLNGRQIAEAKQWATTTGSTTAEFHKVPAAPAVPVDMVLHCPACGLQHIDAPDPWVAKYGEELCKAKGFSLWTNPPHKSHLCRGCGHVWRPADVATAGVKAVSTKGKEDGPIKEPVARQTLPAPAVPDPWKSAVLDRLAATCMDAQQDEPPASILRRIIDWEVTVALDPAVSDIAPYLCIKPACGPDCSGCNCAISPQDMRDYAIRYAILRNAPINAIRGGGVFAGKTPDNVVINGEHLDAAVDALRGITGDSK